MLLSNSSLQRIVKWTESEQKWVLFLSSNSTERNVVTITVCLSFAGITRRLATSVGWFSDKGGL